jgi:hypothetical protein
MNGCLLRIEVKCGGLRPDRKVLQPPASPLCTRWHTCGWKAERVAFTCCLSELWVVCPVFHPVDALAVIVWQKNPLSA